MKTPDPKLKNLKETRIPCPSFRRDYTFFTYSRHSFAVPPNTFSLHKNTLNPYHGRDVVPPASQTCSFVPPCLSVRFFPPSKHLTSRGVTKFPAYPRKTHQSTFPSQVLETA